MVTGTENSFCNADGTSVFSAAKIRSLKRHILKNNALFLHKNVLKFTFFNYSLVYKKHRLIHSEVKK